jgi:hypothetical protein
VHWVNKDAFTVFTLAESACSSPRMGRACFVLACIDPFFRV